MGAGQRPRTPQALYRRTPCVKENEFWKQRVAREERAASPSKLAPELPWLEAAATERYVAGPLGPGPLLHGPLSPLEGEGQLAVPLMALPFGSHDKAVERTGSRYGFRPLALAQRSSLPYSDPSGGITGSLPPHSSPQVTSSRPGALYGPLPATRTLSAPSLPRPPPSPTAPPLTPSRSPHLGHREAGPPSPPPPRQDREEEDQAAAQAPHQQASPSPGSCPPTPSSPSHLFHSPNRFAAQAYASAGASALPGSHWQPGPPSSSATRPAALSSPALGPHHPATFSPASTQLPGPDSLARHSTRRSNSLSRSGTLPTAAWMGSSIRPYPSSALQSRAACEGPRGEEGAGAGGFPRVRQWAMVNGEALTGLRSSQHTFPDPPPLAGPIVDVSASVASSADPGTQRSSTQTQLLDRIQQTAEALARERSVTTALRSALRASSHSAMRSDLAKLHYTYPSGP